MQNTLSIIVLDQKDITDFAAARNEELAKAKTPARNASHSDAGGGWVLFVDSDEKITPELKDEVLKAIESKNYDAYYIPRLDTFMGRELRHGETGSAKFIRLARKDYGKWERPVHEMWVGKGKVGTLTSPLLHESHKTISSFLDKINLYSTIDAEYRYKQGIKSSLWKIWLYPFAKFKFNYFLKLGFLDGTPGAIMAIMMSFHSYLTWTKLYLLWQNK
jgi:glycosyltransferase involved in cell wall biosynthesis